MSGGQWSSGPRVRSRPRRPDGTGPRAVFSGWTVKPYLLVRLGKTSMIRRASSSRATPITKSSA